MTIRNLSPLLHAGSIAVVGGSDRAGSLGAIVLDNILASGFPGPVHVVNPRPIDRPGVAWAASVSALSQAPDLAIVVTPAATVPAIVADLGARGTRCAVIISAGVTEASGLRQPMLAAAAAHGMRIVGPNCLGIAAPHIPLDATFARTRAAPGRLALISQSGALVTAVLDWARARGIGFSGVVSAGDMADVDLGDLVDLFAEDPGTDAILIYLEGVTDAPEFLAAARAAARRKPVIAIKAGKSPLAARAALSHTGALAGSYDVYRAAFARAGIVLVDTLTALFDAAAILCAARPACGDRLGIVTNGGGAGILAIDALDGAKAQLASLETATIDALTAALPAGWSHGNPVDVLGDTGPDRYRAAVRAVLRDPGVDALLLMNCPTGQFDAVDIATAIGEEVEAARADHIAKPVLACWLGDANAAAVREPLGRALIPVYATPDDAVRGFGYLLAARRARLSLTDSLAATRSFATDAVAARAIITAARAEGRTLLSEIEAKGVLTAYGIPVAHTRFAQTAALASAACASLTAPYALKIVSPDISHKSDVGGVVLNLADGEAVAAAAGAMEARIRREHPDARLLGFAVEEMVVRPGAREMIVGIATDATFGPVLLAGTGGTAVEVIADKALTLPPIDHAQALALVRATAISKLLEGYRNVPPVNVDSVAAVLDGLSAMTVDLPDIVELDINPLLVDTDGAIGLDARIRIAAEPQTHSRLALRPPPFQWSADLVARSGMRIHVRAVRADDEPALARFFEKVSQEDLRFRFMTGLARVDHDRLAMMTRVDYWRTISFLALDESGDIVATAMLATDPDRTRAEVALVTRDDMKGKGVSWALFEHVLRYAQAEGIGTVEALECADHEAALQMERELGFTTRIDPDDTTVRIARRVFAEQEPS
jgi:acetyltransferase